MRDDSVSLAVANERCAVCSFFFFFNNSFIDILYSSSN